ncbi:MAG: saccharopine dehydrogenase NADP-binding domain-containing protein [Chloroflexi bacterium]|nr:saccharopine dehydrogenase NADP-binding domain-containing protein [Chloroflexota bacterium]
MTNQPFLLYGSTGYTGDLIARLAVKQGLRPILAGRNREKLTAQATELGLECRSFSLDDPATIDTALKDVSVVLHCAGPFSHTSKPMAMASLRTKTNYLDITGEIGVFESLARHDADAKAAGIMLLPGVGFDVVPSDCLSAHLKRRLSSATRLTLAFRNVGGRLSHGTATTMIETIHLGGAIRANGKIVRVPSAWRSRLIDYGRGPVKSVTIPWGDVSTAFYSTGIPNIQVYSVFPPMLVRLMVLGRYTGALFATPTMQSMLKRVIQSQPAGPTEQQRAKGISLLWGQAEDDSGKRVTSRMRTPEGYALTAMTALAIVQRVLAGDAPIGFKTPSLAYGTDFILQFDNVAREDIE